MRKDNFARYTNITESENVKFTQTTEDLKPPTSELFLFGHSQTYRHVHVHVCVCSVAMGQDMTTPPPPLYQDGGMNLRVRPRVNSWIHIIELFKALQYWLFYPPTHSLTHSPTHFESISKFQKALLVRYSRTCIYNGPVLSGQFSKSLFFTHTNAIFVTCIRWPPLLSGRGHPVAVLGYVCLSLLFLPVLSGHPWTETNMIQYQ